MRKIKIAQIGTGHDHALMNLFAIRAFPDIFELVGYAEIPEDDMDNEWQNGHKTTQKEKCGCLGLKSYTIEELFAIPDLEAVAVETYDLNLVKYAQMAADRCSIGQAWRDLFSGSADELRSNGRKASMVERF